MTQGVTHLETDPDFIEAAHLDNFFEEHSGIQCLNIPHIQALKLGYSLPQLQLPLSNKFVVAIMEEHLHYAKQYSNQMDDQVRQMEFAVQARQYTFESQAMMKTFGRVTMVIITFIAIGHKFSLRIMFLAVLLAWAVQPTQMAPISTIQGLHNTLLYIRFQKVYNWLQSGFGPKQYAEMETAMVDAIIQLRQIATPPPTTTTKTPIYQTKDERIHGILQTFVDKTLNTTAEEKEEKKQASGLTKQQEQMYATE